MNDLLPDSFDLDREMDEALGRVIHDDGTRRLVAIAKLLRPLLDANEVAALWGMAMESDLVRLETADDLLLILNPEGRTYD